MRKKLVNEKRDELKQLSNRELIDRILSYPDRDSLDYDPEGNRRPFPVGMVAQNIRNHQDRMTENQYYALIHNFSAITVPEMRVVGVTFRKNNAAEFEKTLIRKDGVKSVYETDYHLVPEPENKYDANAVKVMVPTENGDLHQIGYLNKEFVAAHPISDELEVKGYLTDHSNGKFKNVSYSLAVDTEHLEQYRLGSYLYEAPFTFDPPDHRVELNMTETFHDFDINPALRDAVTRVDYTLERSGQGSLQVTASRPLTMAEQSQALEYLLADEPEASFHRIDKKAEEFELTDDMLQGIGDLSLDQAHADPRVYEAPFSLKIPVNDLEAAREYLAEEDMTEALAEQHPELREKVSFVEWKLKDEMSGVIRVETMNPLTEGESETISDWISAQCSDGIGEGFEQQDFATERFEEAEEDYDAEPQMASFDWDINSYHLRDRTPEPELQADQDPVYRYERPFKVNATVMEPERANEDLKDLSRSVLLGSLNGDLEVYHEKPTAVKVGWEFTDAWKGTAFVETREPLSDDGLYLADRWMEHQQQNGNVAAKIRQEPFTAYGNKLPLFQPEFAKLAPVTDHPQAEHLPDVSLKEDDLAFAHQMELSDYGL